MINWNGLIRKLDHTFSIPSDPGDKFKYRPEDEVDQKMLEYSRKAILKIGDLCFNKCVNHNSKSFSYDEQVCVKNCTRDPTYRYKNMIKKIRMKTKYFVDD